MGIYKQFPPVSCQGKVWMCDMWKREMNFSSRNSCQKWQKINQFIFDVVIIKCMQLLPRDWGNTHYFESSMFHDGGRSSNNFNMFSKMSSFNTDSFSPSDGNKVKQKLKRPAFENPASWDFYFNYNLFQKLVFEALIKISLSNSLGPNSYSMYNWKKSNQRNILVKYWNPIFYPTFPMEIGKQCL